MLSKHSNVASVFETTAAKVLRGRSRVSMAITPVPSLDNSISVPLALWLKLCRQLSGLRSLRIFLVIGSMPIEYDSIGAPLIPFGRQELSSERQITTTRLFS